MATPESSSDNRPPEPARGGNRGYGSYGSYGNYGAGNGGYGYGNSGAYNRGGAGEGNPIHNYLLMLRERYWWILLAALVQAREQRVGLWQDPSPVEPSVFRHQK